MTDIESVLRSAERELRASGAVGEPTCRAFEEANAADRHGLEPAFAFLGCVGRTGEAGRDPVPTARRVEAVRLMLLKLSAQTESPRWSSYLLDQLFEAAMRPPGAEIGDIVRALFDLLGEHAGDLTKAQANLIRDVGVRIIGLHRRAYAAQDFSWLARAVLEVSPGVTPAQAYLTAAVLPPAFIPQSRDAIMLPLRGTEFADQVARNLAD
jgi:hypothetical protein